MDARCCAVVPLSLAVALVVGCAPVGITRAGTPDSPVVLRVALADAPARFGDEVVGALAEALEQETRGALTVEIDRVTDDGPRWNQTAAERVIDGDSPLGLVPAQSWDAFGIQSHTALYVPFAVTSDELVDAIAQSDVAGDMLAGLEPLGLTGLALVPGGLRTVFRAHEPLTGPDTYAGRGVRVAYSEAVWAWFDAIGALPDDPNGDDLDRLVDSGAIVGYDSMFRIADGFLDAPAAAADTISHPHVLTIVANHEAVAALSAEHRAALRRAAEAVVDWSVRTRPRTAEEAAALCARAPGAVVENAGPEAVAALRDAARPVTESLLAEPGVAAFAARIEEIDERLGRPVTEIEPCRGPPFAEAGTSPPNVPEVFPEGFYRREVTFDELTAAGVDASTAANHVGVWDLELRDGILVGDGCPGSTYEIVDDRIVVSLGPEGDLCGDAAGEVLFSAGWRLDESRLTFTAVESGHGSDLLVRAIFGGGPWTRLQ